MLVLGAGLGAAAGWLAARSRAGAASAAARPERLTAAWSIAELGAGATVVARDLDRVPLSPGCRAVVAGRCDAETLRNAQVRRAAAVPAEFALSADGRRALLFTAGVRSGGHALAVAEPELTARLAALAASLWAEAVPYVERRAVADLAGEPGLPVESEGVVTQVVARDRGVLLRLEDGGAAAAVHAKAEVPTGSRVRIRGRLARDAGGYPVVEADDVTRLD
jgi:hypothetical protein